MEHGRRGRPPKHGQPLDQRLDLALTADQMAHLRRLLDERTRAGESGLTLRDVARALVDEDMRRRGAA